MNSVSAAASSSAAKPTPSTLTLPALTLRYGMQGTGVRQLQRVLVRLGYLTQAQVATGPGIFGPRTLAALKAFQAKHGIPPSGVMGTRSRPALLKALSRAAGNTVPSPSPAPVKPTPAPTLRKLPLPTYAGLKAWVETHGGQFRTAPGKVNLVALRRPNSTYVNGGAGVYDDTLYAVWKDGQGKAHVRKFHFNSEPAQDVLWGAADVNGDGRRDMGRLRAGFYDYVPGTWKGGQPCLRPLRDGAVERDMNHDGRFTERRTSPSGAGSMLFHRGGTNATWSAGCQTLPYNEWDDFWRVVRSAKGAIGYTLVQV